MPKKQRKILISVMVKPEHLTYLDRKIRANIPERHSRNALIRFLIDKAMENNTL